MFIFWVYLYEFEGETIEKSKSRTRGVHIKKTANSNILHGSEFDNIFNYGYEEIRVKKLKECVIQDKLDEFNTFQKQTKLKDINFDTKRIWDFNYDNIDQVRKMYVNVYIHNNEITEQFYVSVYVSENKETMGVNLVTIRCKNYHIVKDNFIYCDTGITHQTIEINKNTTIYEV